MNVYSGSTSDQVDTGTINQACRVGVTTMSSPSRNQSVSASLDDEFRYRMDYPERGCFLIFNQEVGCCMIFFVFSCLNVQRCFFKLAFLFFCSKQVQLP